MRKRRDAAMLGDAVIDEIYYRLLCDERGGELRFLLQQRGQIQPISKAVEYIHQNLDRPVSVDELAKMVHMSRPTLFARLQTLATSSPAGLTSWMAGIKSTVKVRLIRMQGATCMTGTKNGTRPTSLTEWFERASQSWFPLVAESKRQGLSHRPIATDLFISPYAKCGTTWLQQIVHGLRTHGDMDFDDVSRVVPWLETAQLLGLDLQAPQQGAFRAFKSHLSWDEIPKGGRYIVSFRDPKDALVSHHRFFDSWHWEAGSVSIEEFAKRFYLAKRRSRWAGSYWHHLTSWWEQRRNRNVLLLCYEDMKTDLPGTVQTIASFLGLEPDKALLELVTRQASLDFMLAHKEKYADPLVREAHFKLGFLPPGGDSAKVRNGRVGDHRTELPAEIGVEMDAIWREVVEARVGLPSYQALREALA